MNMEDFTQDQWIMITAAFGALLVIAFILILKIPKKTPKTSSLREKDSPEHYPHFYHKSKTIEFWDITGTVSDTSKFSETHVWSSGGGGHTGPNGGHVSPVSIHSKSITNHEFWIHTDDGRQVDIQLRDVNIPLRKGQRISMIYAQKLNAKSGRAALLVNHSAQKHWPINTAAELNNKIRIDKISGLSLVIGGAIGWGVYNLYSWASVTLLELNLRSSNALEHTLWIVGSLVAARLIYRFFRITHMTVMLDEHLKNEVSTAVYKRRETPLQTAE